MKNLKVFITAITLTLFTTSSVFAIADTTAKDNLRSELVSLLGDQSSIEIDTESLKANVSFVINEENQIVVISIDSKNKKIDAFVKGRLNYKNVTSSGIKKGEIYTMPLKIKNEK